MKTLLALACLLFLPDRPASASEQKFFPGNDMQFGVYYYAEHWPESQWERDISRIAELGFDFIHCAEFAWQRMEPAEGQFDFTWLDRVVELADQHGLKVLMCTPTPCPPAWLPTKYPETLLVDRNGRRIHHNGARLTGSLANPVFRQHSSRVVTELAKRYANDERIIGWQIGNEPHIATGADYSPSALKAFKAWLKKKYGTVERLNHAWGGPFWSYTLASFDEIKMPFPTMPGPSPHTYLDFQTYTSHEIARNLRRQTDIIREHCGENQWVTTNYAYFKGLPNVNPFLTRKDFDFTAHTMYVTSNIHKNSGDSMAHRLGSGMEYAFCAELARSVHGYSGIMELQPGQINWGRFNSMPKPGAVGMWVWHAFALQHRFVCTYRYRQPLFGVEQFHHGIMQTDGVSLSHGGADFVKAMREIQAISDKQDTARVDSFDRKSRTAMLWSNRNMMDLKYYKHHVDWDSWDHFYTYYESLKRMGVEIDVVTADDRYSPEEHPFLIVPSYQMMSRELIAKLDRYSKEGGHLIVTTRTALKNELGHLWEAKIQQPIWDLIGGEIEFYDHLPAKHPGTVSFQDKAYPWHIWGTVIEPFDDTRTWASYTDQFYAGKSAILHRPNDRGTVTYVGVWSDDSKMEYGLLRKLYRKALGELPYDLPEYVFVHPRRGLRVGVNYTDTTEEIPIPKGVQPLVGDRTLDPGEVVVWEIEE